MNQASPNTIITSMYAWLGTKIHSVYAPYILFGLFCLEAIVIVPVTSILAFFCLERRGWSFYYAALASIGSIVGGILGYSLGYFLWDSLGQKIVTFFFKPEQFNRAVEFYKQHESLAVLLAGFTPVPYKLISLSAGFCKLSLLKFVMCSFISRSVRFFGVATLIYYVGPDFKKYVRRYSRIFLPLIALAFVCGVWYCLYH